MESERPGRRFVGNAAVTVNHVEAVGPSGVGALGSVVESIHDGWKLDPESCYADLADCESLSGVLWAGKDHAVRKIVWVLPNVASVSFVNVNDVKLTLSLY